MKIIRGVFRIFLFGILLAFSFIFASNVWIVQSTKQFIYSNVEDIPEIEVAVVLGTSKKFLNGQPNKYFQYRMEAAAEVYQKGIVKTLILSGDNRTRYYNEPVDMKNALLRLGIPTKDIVMDSAGINTFDSVVRGKEVFGKNKFVIITQKFHAFRAVFIGRRKNIETYAYTAQNLPPAKSFKLHIREYLARAKAVLDIYIFKNKSDNE